MLIAFKTGPPSALILEYLFYIANMKKTTKASFSVLIGSPVRDQENIPHGMVGRLILPQKYCVKRAKGALPNAFIEAWRMAWSSDIKRSYKFDFEVYDDRAQETNNAEVDTFIAVTKAIMQEETQW